MMKTLRDVVEWNLCMGCGACAFACDKQAVEMQHVEERGIVPRFLNDACKTCSTCLDFCPGCNLDTGLTAADTALESYTELVGRTYAVWEGYAAREELRYKAASGGVLSALALYCLEREGCSFVLHTGKDPADSLFNRTQLSRSLADILAQAGSRYAPSSPCAGLAAVEEPGVKAVFIGKPCDVAAVAALRKQRPELDKNLRFVFSFFCAGTPQTGAIRSLLAQSGVDSHALTDLKFRGEGWPGLFAAKDKNGKSCALTYEASWGYLSHYRPFRCQLCPDGLGELSDVTCGDAWHRFRAGGSDPGRSLILARSEEGRALVQRAAAAGYIVIEPSTAQQVVEAQGMVRRRRELHGRLQAMRMLFLPVPAFRGFFLEKSWRKLALAARIKVILGTLRRLVVKGLWHKAR